MTAYDAEHESPASLVRMANQIASNAEHRPHAEAVDVVAAHLREFWAPSMRTRLLEHVDAGGEGLSPLVREAVQHLR